MTSSKGRGEQPLRSRARSKRSLAFALLLILVGIAPAASAQQPAPAVLNAKAPELEEPQADDWLNSPPLKLSELRGRDNHWWPSIYLIDKKGIVRYRWDGELNWKGAGGKAIMEKKIAELLAEEIPATAKN
jgi:hypothetical protein